MSESQPSCSVSDCRWYALNGDEARVELLQPQQITNPNEINFASRTLVYQYN
jgi:hypothetical protein